MLIQKVRNPWIVLGVFGAIGFGCFSCQQESFKLSMPLSAQSENTPSPLTPTATASAAPDVTASPTQPNCQNTLTQAEINACSGQTAKKADQELNAVYQKLRLSLKDSPRSQQLVDAQLAWIQFRDANCTFEKSRYEGGSISSSIFSGCIEQMTRQRMEQLKHYLEPS